MALTRNNIAYNLKESPFKESIEYDGFQITYVFSSQNNRIRFLSRLGEHRKKINTSLSNRFKMDIEINSLSDLQLYKNIEKRGFLVKCKEVEFTCLNSIRFDGNVPMKRNFEE